MSPNGQSRGAPPVRPQVHGLALAAERDRLVGDAEPRVDLERARVHGDRARLLCGTGMTVDDLDADPAPRELAGEHQAGRSRADDQHVDVGRRGAHPFTPPDVSPPTTRSWNTAIRMQIGTIATTSAAEISGHGNANSPW